MEWEGKYKSELLMVSHMDARAMHKVGAISDKEMLEYDRDCLVNPRIEQKSNSVYNKSNSVKIEHISHATV